MTTTNTAQLTLYLQNEPALTRATAKLGPPSEVDRWPGRPGEKRPPRRARWLAVDMKEAALMLLQVPVDGLDHAEVGANPGSRQLREHREWLDEAMVEERRQR